MGFYGRAKEIYDKILAYKKEAIAALNLPIPNAALIRMKAEDFIDFVDLLDFHIEEYLDLNTSILRLQNEGYCFTKNPLRQD